jgi:hypothetical protein
MDDFKLEIRKIKSIYNEFTYAFKEAREYVFANINKKDFIIEDQRSGDCTTALDSEVYEKFYKPIAVKYNMVLICEESNPYGESINTKGQEYILILDPIDGTKNMMFGLQFGVNIAFGKIPSSGGFNLNHIKCVYIADYLSMKSFSWIQGDNSEISPPIYSPNLKWGRYKAKSNIYEVPDSKTYIDSNYPEGEHNQNNLLKLFSKLFKELHKENKIQRRAIDCTGLRLLEVADNNLFAYGDVRRATRVWDTIPSIKYLMETCPDLAIFDFSFSEYSDNSVILRANSGSIYELEDRIGREVIIIPKIHFEKFKSLASCKSVFIVHGRDNSYTNEIARFIENEMALECILLEEKVNRGQTIMEKLINYSEVQAAIILITPDDEGRLRNSGEELKTRARQNVIFEMGLFYGILGRENVIAMYKSVEKPSDIDGVLYIDLDDSGYWKYQLQRELNNIIHE